DYALKPLADAERFQEFEQAGHEMCASGCFNDASKQYRAVAQQEPNDPAAWYNIGLCDAWAGDDPLAVEAFRVSASLEADFESAVECAGLAQILAAHAPKNQVNLLTTEYRANS